MKTSVLIQSLARWISEIATTMIWRCFKAKGNVAYCWSAPISHLLFTGLSLSISLHPPPLSLFLYPSLVPSFFPPSDTLRWIDAVTETLVACQLLNKQLAKGSLSQETSQSEVRWSSALACYVSSVYVNAHPVTEVRNMTSRVPDSCLIILYDTFKPLWIIEFIRFGCSDSAVLHFVLNAENVIYSGSLRL